MSALRKFARLFLDLFDLRRAEGWRLLGYLVIYSTLADALHMDGTASWIGVGGVVIVHETQKSIEGRGRHQR